MRFLVDAQLPSALARWIVDCGHDALHVHDIGFEGASDRTIWHEALRREAVILTKDEDFIRIGGDASGPQVVWIRWGNTSRRVLLERMAAIFPQIVSALKAGERVVEIR